MGVREGYDQELLEVQTDILLMGETAILALEKSIQALVELDVTTAEQIMAADDVIDQMEIDIENKYPAPAANEEVLPVFIQGTIHRAGRAHSGQARDLLGPTREPRTCP